MSTSSATTSNSSCSTSNGDGGDSHSRYIGTHFLALARSGSVPPLTEDEREEAPTELNTINSSGGFLVVSPDKLSVKYTNVNLHGHDVGVIQANKPAPVHRLVYYFEIFVKDAGAKGQVAIGFTSEGFKMRRQPGWELNSCGYHGDDGYLYRGQGRGDPFGPTYTTGDTVGAGINYGSQEFFFTKNGTFVGRAYKTIFCPLFPTVAVHSQNEEVHVNFGQKNFVFDVKEYEAVERKKQQAAAEEAFVPPNVSHGLVRSYLLHYGYEETLNAFDLAAKSTIPPICIAEESASHDQFVEYALNHRKTLRELIRSGDIDSALSKLLEWYPQIVQDDKSFICLLLQCQKFIELVRAGKLMDAVKHGRRELQKFFGWPAYEDLIKDCVSLLAYENPYESSVGYLLRASHLEMVADAVNAMVLVTNPNMKDPESCVQSKIEKVLRQLSACCLERKIWNGNEGEDFDLKRVLSTGKKLQ